MGAITRERLRHEKEKRKLRDRLEAAIRDTLSDEGFSNFAISMIVGAALVAIGLIVAPEPVSSAIGAGIGAAVIIVVAACMIAWGVSELSTDSIKQYTEKYGEREDAEDQQFLENMERLGAE